MARLTVLRGSDRAVSVPDAALDTAVRALDQLKADAARARGAAREAIINRLAALDATLVAAVIEAMPKAERSGLDREVAEQLEPFRARMDPSAYARATRVALERQVRQRIGLPDVAFGQAGAA
jgi:hypothetical protein